MHTSLTKRLPGRHMHLLFFIIPPLQGLHSDPIKPVLFRHLHDPFKIFPPLHLFINPFGIRLCVDDTTAMNNKYCRLLTRIKI